MIRGISDDYGGKDDDDNNDVNGKDSGDEDDDGDDTCDSRELKQLRRRRRRQPQKTIGLMIKTTALHVHHAFLVNFFDFHCTTTT